ncbi:MAG: hypothetical protein NZ750_00055 [Anaerolineae bacterium]|nr:hypothetical protein [Anaerolineae bacterium]MDW8171985.1 hypothetical protein [Anaerolineae bacterium]
MMTTPRAKINLNRLTLPQRRYLVRLHESGGVFSNDKDLNWMVGTREQLIKRSMVEWITDKDGKPCIRMTARGQEALRTAASL